MRVLSATFLICLLLTLGCGQQPQSQSRATASQARTSATEASGDQEATTASNGSGCGVERWAVKTGTDSTVGQVKLTPVVDATVGQLGNPQAYPNPGEPALKAHAASRFAPVELTTYRVKATLTGYKREADSDLHLVLQESGASMIAEIPKAPCVAAGSPFRGAITNARQAFDAKYPLAEEPRLHRLSQQVTVTGVGFFDYAHGQTGVAKNAIELHPVLQVAFS